MFNNLQYLEDKDWSGIVTRAIPETSSLIECVSPFCVLSSFGKSLDLFFQGAVQSIHILIQRVYEEFLSHFDLNNPSIRSLPPFLHIFSLIFCVGEYIAAFRAATNFLWHEHLPSLLLIPWSFRISSKLHSNRWYKIYFYGKNFCYINHAPIHYHLTQLSCVNFPFSSHFVHKLSLWMEKISLTPNGFTHI